MTFSVVDDRKVEIGLKGRCDPYSVRFDSLKHSIDASSVATDYIWEVKAANEQIVGRLVLT